LYPTTAFKTHCCETARRKHQPTTNVTKKVITFKSVVVDVENGRKRSLHEYGRKNVKNIYIVD